MPRKATSSKQPSPKTELSFAFWQQLHNLGLVAVAVVRLQLVAQQSVLSQMFSQEGFAHR
jgi:hypothetical protein